MQKGNAHGMERTLEMQNGMHTGNGKECTRECKMQTGNATLEMQNATLKLQKENAHGMDRTLEYLNVNAKNKLEMQHWKT